MPALNALLLGSLLYQSRLVPRVLPVLGFVGAALLVASTMATVFGANEYGSGLSGLLHSRSRCGSSRWASTWSSRDSGRPVCGSSASRLRPWTNCERAKELKRVA